MAPQGDEPAAATGTSLARVPWQREKPANSVKRSWNFTGFWRLRCSSVQAISSLKGVW